MQRLLFACILAAIAFEPPTKVLAAGAYMPKQPVPVQASVLPVPSLPRFAPSEIFGGCGGKRARDPKTHQCRGPADLGH
jgi:hypothetical protein